MNRTQLVVIILAGLFLVLMAPFIIERISNPPEPIIPAESNLTGTDLVELISATGQWGDIELGAMDTVVDTDAFVEISTREALLDTGPSTFGNAAIRAGGFPGWQYTVGPTSINWNRMIVLQVTFSTPDGAGASSFVNQWFKLGEHDGSIPGFEDEKAIGFTIDGNAISAYGQTDSSNSNVIPITTIVNNLTYTMTIISYGNGNCDFILNGILEVSQNICPIGAHDEMFALLQFETERSSGPRVSYYIHQIRYYIEP